MHYLRTIHQWIGLYFICTLNFQIHSEITFTFSLKEGHFCEFERDTNQNLYGKKFFQRNQSVSLIVFFSPFLEFFFFLNIVAPTEGKWSSSCFTRIEIIFFFLLLLGLWFIFISFLPLVHDQKIFFVGTFGVPGMDLQLPGFDQSIPLPTRIFDELVRCSWQEKRSVVLWYFLNVIVWKINN